MNFDLAIVGGGPAGSSLSLYMAARGWRVVQIDAGRDLAFKPGEGLVPAAKRILRDLKVWDAFSEQEHLPTYGNDSLWGHPQPQSTDFIQSIDGHGWRLDRLGFDRMLREEGERVGVTSLTGFVERVAGEAGAWELHLRDGQVVKSSWLADATGRSARLSRQLGAVRQDVDQLVSFWMHFAPGQPGDRYASSLIESVADGWWYNALLPNGHRVVYFFSDVGSPAQKQAQSLSGFMELLGQTQFVTQKLSAYGYTPIAEPQAADARSARLDRVVGDGWLAVGDAAMSFDPLSSQGILTALYGGIQAGKALEKAGAEGEEAFSGYAEAMESVWDVYLQNKAKFYRTEPRWASEVFWQRRLEH